MFLLKTFEKARRKLDDRGMISLMMVAQTIAALHSLVAVYSVQGDVLTCVNQWRGLSSKLRLAKLNVVR